MASVLVFVLLLFLGKSCAEVDYDAEIDVQQSVRDESGPSFTIDYEKDQFLKDGKPFRYISGSLHYFRVPRIYWLDRLGKMYAAGLNAVQTYIDWSQHEPYPGVYNFEDNLDLVNFIQLAQEVGLLVILRPGPYIDAERDMGGLPFWLLQVKENIVLRSSDPTYLKYVDLWYGKVLPMVEPLLYSNGGPIISVQVENEYGSYYTCDFAYTSHMRDLIHEHLGYNVVLFSTDGAGDSNVKCGKVSGVYATVDFGPGTNVTNAFKIQRNHQWEGPLVNSEYYPGWLDHWGYPHANPEIDKVLGTLNDILLANASVNMYMFHGGTNFGFTNGANIDITFYPVTTSYDYNAPLSEAGDPTEKYFAIRNLISKFRKLPPSPQPKPVPKFGYGKVKMNAIGSLFELMPLLQPTDPIYSKYPITFETLGQAYGFVMYETYVYGQFMDPALLSAPGVHDRAIVMIDERPIGVLSRQDKILSMPLQIENGQKLSLFVENVGRTCFGSGLTDFKGLTANVTLSGQILKNWIISCLPLNNTQQIDFIARNSINKERTDVQKHFHNIYKPHFYAGTFTVPNKTGFPLDTFLDTSGWRKGVAFMNGFNLGRYWPSVGPQITLYIPKSVLKSYPSINMLVLFELEYAPCDPEMISEENTCEIELIDTAYINSTTPNDSEDVFLQIKLSRGMNF